MLTLRAFKVGYRLQPFFPMLPNLFMRTHPGFGISPFFYHDAERFPGPSR